ncbi:MAG: rnc [Micavibrio sp.]|nr:rnc [Micavibrio sp.]
MPGKDPLLTAFESRFGHRFANVENLNLAITHSSTGAGRNYERLEFLGDRVLGLVMAELLYDVFPDEAEGDLAKRHAALVSGETLAIIAEQINLGEVLKLSHGERAGGGAKNENILADVMEALIGAVYLDAGLPPCKPVIASLWEAVLHTMKEPPRDPKTGLQEWAQGRGLPLPKYEMIGRSGPDHAPVFTIAVTVEGFEPLSADGPSRRAAEKAAATLLLNRIEGHS